MKLNKLILAIILLAFSCQNEEEITIQDWIKTIDKTVTNYNKYAVSEDSKILEENNEVYNIKFFNKDSSGVQKITAVLNIENVCEVKKEVYLVNDRVVLDKTKSLFPVIYKGRKKIIDPCCVLSEKLIYYKSSSEGKIYIKQIKMMNTEDKESLIEDLKTMPYQEKEHYDIQKEFHTSQDWVQYIKEI